MERATGEYWAQRNDGEKAEEAQRAAVRKRMQQYKSFQLTLKQNNTSIPPILQIIKSSRRKQATDASSNAEIQEEDVD